MKKIHYLLLLTLLVTLSSCVTNKEGYLAEFEKFVQGVEEKKSISEDEMKSISAKFEVYSQKYYDKFKDTMSSEDLQEVTRLEVRYYKALARNGFNEVKNQLKKAATAIEEIFNN